MAVHTTLNIKYYFYLKEAKTKSKKKEFSLPVGLLVANSSKLWERVCV